MFNGYTESDEKVQARWQRWCSIADAELKRRAEVDQQVMRQVAGEVVAAEISAGHKTLATMPEDTRISRREQILAAFRDEPLNLVETEELINELAEIDQSLQIHPSDTLQDRMTAQWSRMEEFPF